MIVENNSKNTELAIESIKEITTPESKHITNSKEDEVII